jgi:RHS repeat-associated protein
VIEFTIFAKQTLTNLITIKLAGENFNKEMSMATTNFIWDELSDNVLLETDGNGTLTARYTNRPEQFGNLISQYRIEDETIVKSFYHYDGEYSTSALTDENEDITDTFTYTAYGEEVARTGTTTNPFGYKGAVGYYTNASTGDIYVRNRSYGPAIGRWLSTDPLGFIDGTSLYRGYFVPGNIDPFGLACQAEKCCCCPEDLTINITERLPEDIPNANGHIFRVDMKLRIVSTNQENPKFCKFEWYEFASRWPAYYPPFLPYTWHDVYSLPPTNSDIGDIFASFRAIERHFHGQCENQRPTYIEDSPAIGFGIVPNGRRTGLWLIILSKSPGCTCEHSSISVAFQQILRNRNGKVDTRFGETRDKHGVWTPDSDNINWP